MAKKIKISMDYCDYPSMSNSEFKGAIGMVEDAIDSIEGVDDFDVKTKGLDFGSAIIEVAFNETLTDEDEILEEIKAARESGYDWKVGDSYQFEII